MKLPSVNKKLAIAGAVVILGGATAGALTISNNGGATEVAPVIQQQSDELANHEARITNNENNIKDLQDKTGTPTSSSNVSVPAASQPVAVSTPAPTPVTVTAFEKIALDANNIDCKYIYSDGTTYQWHWQTYNPQGSWQTDSFGQNGHWVPVTSTTNDCSNNALGKPKLD